MICTVALMLTYAEIHYRPFGLPSLVYRSFPEIVFDAPIRTAPGNPIPLFMFIKDAHNYPVTIDTVIVHIRYEDGSERVARFPYGGLIISTQMWWDSINILPEKTGAVRIYPYMLLTSGKRHYTVHVDSYNGTAHNPLYVYVASLSYPGEEGWYHGDIHCHTYYTNDQVEFGAPIEAMAFAAHCMGMKWFAATDHSYDLDDRMDNYRVEDPFMLKWRSMKQHAELLKESLGIITGEEVTCRTHAGRNCHMLALNSGTFIRGSGDSGENGLDTTTEKTVGEAVSTCLEWGGIACAAHPMEKIPLLEQLILKRGEWTISDLETPGITAMQFYNGTRDGGFRRGKKTWIQLLLKGRRIFVYGGNDAHGDMNRSRKLSLPLVSVSETENHVFGTVRTVVRAQSFVPENIIEALRDGRAVVTDGPFIDLTVRRDGNIAYPGGETPAGDNRVQAVFMSTPEFGCLKRCKIFAAVLGEEIELALNESKGSYEYTYVFDKTIELKSVMYLRAECETERGSICFTNPIWVTG